jgi:hypothetical protein
MKVKIVAVLAATTALAFTAAGSAAAQTLGPANQHESAAAAQVTGVRLQTAMLPTSAFGPDIKFSEALNSGAKLRSTQVHDHVPSMSCSAFDGAASTISVFGDTAAAEVRYSNPDAASAYPNTIVNADQRVLQFATVAAADTFYSQARSKYTGCVSFVESFPGAPRPAAVDLRSVAKTTVSGHQAFVVIQYLQVPGLFGEPSFYHLYLFVVAGTNVYDFYYTSGTNDTPSSALMSDLIHRVQALYPHH